MYRFSFAVMVLVLAVSTGCVRSMQSRVNGRVVSESTAISAPGFNSLSSNVVDQPYDACMARAGSMPNKGLVTATCMDNAMRALVREQCPQYMGFYTPNFWRSNSTYMQCLEQVGWMPEGQDEAICLKQTMIQNSSNLCAMLAPTTGSPYGGIYTSLY